MKESIKKQFEEHIEAVKSNLGLIEDIEKAAKLIVISLSEGNKVIICGNGGSAADAQHIAAELIGRYEKNRHGLPAVSLTTDASTITSWANDDCFENVFVRQVDGLGKAGDVLIVLTTSGNSENIIRAVQKAKEKGIRTVAFTGKDGGKIKGMADVEIHVKHKRTSRIQEVHQLCYHIMCGLIEDNFS